jgi:tetratricopeptide (TPR) repeat protein
VRRWAALLLAAAVALGDEESALYFLGRAKEALEAGDVDRAAEFLQKSAKEREGYAPTLLLLAEVAKRRGQRDTAVVFLEACLEQRARGDLTVSEREAVAAAEKMLAELDEARAEFVNLVADHVAEVRKLAGSTKDQDLAKECWRTILLVDPQNGEARERLAPPAPPAPSASGTPLFNGKDLEGWNGNPPDWTLRDGLLTGRSKVGTGTACKQELTGSYTLVCVARIKGQTGPNPVMGIVFAMRGEYDYFIVGVGDSSWRLSRRTEANRQSDLQSHSFKRFSRKFNSADWHTYRIEVDGKRVRCSVDDRELWTFSGADRELDGHAGLWVRDVEMEVRSLTFEQAKGERAK